MLKNLLPITAILVLLIHCPPQAVEFYDDFNQPHNYLTEATAGTGWDGFVAFALNCKLSLSFTS